jgi:ureidoacrylate peracid hydrolase
MAADVALDPRSTAILAVDFQNDFCSPGGHFETAGFDIGPCVEAAQRTQALIDRVRPLGVTVVYTKTEREESPPHRLRSARGQNTYVPGAWGTELMLAPAPGDAVIPKERQSPFHRTALEEELRARGIETVAVAGVTTNCCVDCAIRDAHVRDFDVVVLTDCVGAFGSERHLHDATLANAAKFFGILMSSEELTAAVQR